MLPGAEHLLMTNLPIFLVVSWIHLATCRRARQTTQVPLLGPRRIIIKEKGRHTLYTSDNLFHFRRRGQVTSTFDWDSVRKNEFWVNGRDGSTIMSQDSTRNDGSQEDTAW